MYRTDKARECLKGIFGWKNHYDDTEIPNLDPAMNESESGEFYQEKHPALRLDIIKSTIPSNRDLEEYLNEVEDSAITELLNDISDYKKIKKVGKEIVTNDVIYNTEGFVNDTIVNEGRFVGVMFRPDFNIGLELQINRLALQMTQAQTSLTLYLYHSHKTEPLETIDYTTTQGGQFNWQQVDLSLYAEREDLAGGSFCLGYYQDDITGNAIEFKKLNWVKGYCGGCDGGVAQRRYHSINKYARMEAFYVPSASLDPSRNMFDMESVIYTDSTNWGFNFNITVKCDLTNFWCDNRMSLRSALALKVVFRILRDISYSTQINYVEEQIKMLIIRDLEGDNETKYINIPERYKHALKAVNFDHSSINSVCLPCSVNSGVTYTSM